MRPEATRSSKARAAYSVFDGVLVLRASGERQDHGMPVIWWLAAADAGGAVYLIRYGLRRERRDKARVIIVGGMLAVCAAALLVIGWPRSGPPRPAPPAPSSTAAPATAA